MSRVMSLAEAVAVDRPGRRYGRDGRLHPSDPHAAGHEIIRQGREAPDACSA